MAEAHIQKHVQKKRKQSKKQQSPMIDKLMLVVAFVYPLTGLGQAIEIFNNQDAAGVSLIAWGGFIFFGLIYFFYALAHRLIPLIIAQIFWIIIEIAVVIGIILYGQ